MTEYERLKSEEAAAWKESDELKDLYILAQDDYLIAFNKYKAIGKSYNESLKTAKEATRVASKENERWNATP